MKKVTKFLSVNTSIPILIGIMIIATILDVSFMAPGNLFNVFNQNAIKGIMAIGMSFVILNGFFDMSLCTLLSLTAALACGLQPKIGVAGAVLVALLVGLIVGIINGLLVAYVGINAFVVTLALMLGCRGFAYIYPDEQSISATSDAFRAFGTGKLGPLTYISWLYIIGLLIAHYVLRYTSHGRNTYAAGGNASAAENAGINVRKTIFINFVMNIFVYCADIRPSDRQLLLYQVVIFIQPAWFITVFRLTFVTVIILAHRTPIESILASKLSKVGFCVIQSAYLKLRDKFLLHG